MVAVKLAYHLFFQPTARTCLFVCCVYLRKPYHTAITCHGWTNTAAVIEKNLHVQAGENVKYKRVWNKVIWPSSETKIPETLKGLGRNPRNSKRSWKAVKYFKQHKNSPFPMVTLLLNVMLTKQNFFFVTCINSVQSVQTHANSNQTMSVLGTFFVKKKKYLPFACTRHLQS